MNAAESAIEVFLVFAVKHNRNDKLTTMYTLYVIYAEFFFILWKSLKRLNLCIQILGGKMVLFMFCFNLKFFELSLSNLFY